MLAMRAKRIATSISRDKQPLGHGPKCVHMTKRKTATPTARAVPNRTRTRLAPEVRRRQILEAALVEFNALGFAAASISRIARRAGISKANIYVHFTNKDDMFETLLERLMTRSQGKWSQMLDVQSAEEFVDRLVESAYGGLTEDTIAIARLLITEGHRVPHLLSKWSTANLRARKERQAIIDRLVAAKVVQPSPLTEHFSIAMAPVVYSAVAEMVWGRNKAAAEVEAVKEAHRKLLTLLLVPPRTRKR